MLRIRGHFICRVSEAHRRDKEINAENHNSPEREQSAGETAYRRYDPTYSISRVNIICLDDDISVNKHPLKRD